MKKIYAKVKTEEQCRAVTADRLVDAVIVDADCCAAVREKPAGKELFFAMPEIWRESQNALQERELPFFRSAETQFDGILIENLDELGFLCENGYEGTVVAGEFFYIYNPESVWFLRSLFRQVRFLAPPELTLQELRVLETEAGADFICKVYGHQKLMVTAQCLYRNYGRCRKDGSIELLNQKKERFYVGKDCRQCGDLIFNGLPTCLLDKLEEIPYENLYLDFTVETGAQVENILQLLEASLKEPVRPSFPFTRGHAYKKID